MNVITAPNRVDYLSEIDLDLTLFLAGSIEMGNAVDWQSKVIDALKPHNGTIFNPRRPDWDSSWEQRKDNSNFRQQVEWELDMLASSDIIAMYLDPNTKSPISLLEFGLFAPTHKIILYCPDGFWRKGNIDIVAERFSIPVFKDYDKWLEDLIKHVKLFML